MDAVCDAFGLVLHRRQVRFAWNAVWVAVGHWGGYGQSCPCCRTAVGEVHGTCDACEGTAQSLRVAFRIASFIFEEQSKRVVVAALARSLFRPLPQTVMLHIGEMLPEVHGITAPAGLAAVALMSYHW